MTPTPKWYRLAEWFTGLILLVAVVFAPWAFGTTQEWSVLTLNVLGYILGTLLFFKWLFCWNLGFKPSRWAEDASKEWPVRLLAVVNVLLLLYVLVSALNDRARIDYTYTPGLSAPSGVEIEYLDSVSWLPGSFDRKTTIWAFWKYLAMSMSFWATRDWLLGMSRRERRLSREDRVRAGVPTDRFSSILWTLLLSTAMLSLVGILQRLDGTMKLLWLFEHPNLPVVTFGPFPYRGSASDYLNLIWPIGVAFWLALRCRFLRMKGSAARTGGGPHVVVLLLVSIILIGPFMTSSRGGLLIEAGLIPVCGLILWTSGRLKSVAKWSLMALMVVLVSAGWFLGGEQLVERFGTIAHDKMSGRQDIYSNGSRMVSDFSPWGSGAETFPKLYNIYRASPNQRWEAYVHDDYLETRISFGWVGFSLILGTFLLIPICSRICSGIPFERSFHLLWAASAGGLLLHARFDPPFQVYSIHFTFVILCAMWSCLTPAKE